MVQLIQFSAGQRFGACWADVIPRSTFHYLRHASEQRLGIGDAQLHSGVGGLSEIPKGLTNAVQSLTESGVSARDPSLHLRRQGGFYARRSERNHLLSHSAL